MPSIIDDGHPKSMLSEFVFDFWQEEGEVEHLEPLGKKQIAYMNGKIEGFGEEKFGGEFWGMSAGDKQKSSSRSQHAFDLAQKQILIFIQYMTQRAKTDGHIERRAKIHIQNIAAHQFHGVFALPCRHVFFGLLEHSFADINTHKPFKLL